MIPEVIKKEAAEKAKTSVVKKASTSLKTAVKQANKSTSAKVSASNNINKSIEQSDQRPAQEISSEAQQKQKESLGKIIAMGAAAVTAGVVALYKLVFTTVVE